jgi:glycosyltransferase-like protein
MRIALLTYSTRARGGVVHTLALAEALAARGHAVSVWSLARGGDVSFFRPVDPLVTLRLVPFPDVPEETVGERILRSIDLLGRAFNPQDYDIVHAQDCISANAVPRCIRTIHHLDTFTTPELVQCHDRAIRTPYAHLCVSQSVADEVRTGWGLTPAVISNGIDAVRFAAAAGTPESRRWRSDLGRYVLCVGGIEPRKGTLDLIEAMAVVRQRAPDLRLVIAGGETLFDYRDYRAQVDALASRLQVQPVVLGPVQHDVLPSLVAGAEVFAFPSVKEGFGLAAMEALAAGVPVVMRDLPVLREVFSDAVNYAQTPADLADQLLTPRPGRSTRGRELAASFTWEAAAAAHEQFYASNSPS